MKYLIKFAYFLRALVTSCSIIAFVLFLIVDLIILFGSFVFLALY